MKAIIRILIGGLLGLGAGLAFSHWVEAPRPGVPRSADLIISETSGAFSKLLIQFSSAAPESMLRPFRDFLSQITDETAVYVACKDRDEFALFLNHASEWGVRRPGRFRFVEIGRPITIWSKDRFVVAGGTEGTIVMIPEGPHFGDRLRQNDYYVASALAGQAGMKLERLPLMFDGGDVYATRRIMFANRDLVEKNVPSRFPTEAVFQSYLERTFGKKAVILGKGTPMHHVGMFLTPLDDTTIIAGDPDLARGLAEGDFSDATVQRFKDAIAQLQVAGFKIVRVPLVPTRDEKVYITYNNSIIEERGSHKIVYLPVYGMDRLDRAAADVWTRAGYEVRGIHVDGVYRMGGTIHCLVNVLERH